MAKRTILYSRSAVEGAAIERKLEACRKWARANGCAVIGEFSEVMSGLARELPELEKAIQSANGEGAALVCFVPSDLGRDVRLFVKRMDACKRMGIQVIFVDESGQGRQK